MTGPALRRATAADIPALAALYESSVRRLGPVRYSAEQVDAWATFAGEDDSFRRFVLDAHTLMAHDDDGELVGFAGLRDDGVLASLYVHPERGRRGIGSLLVEALLERARDVGLHRVTTHASDFSVDVFRRAGFSVDAVETVERRGKAFHRHVMSIRLVPS